VVGGGEYAGSGVTYVNEVTVKPFPTSTGFPVTHVGVVGGFELAVVEIVLIVTVGKDMTVDDADVRGGKEVVGGWRVVGRMGEIGGMGWKQGGGSIIGGRYIKGVAAMRLKSPRRKNSVERAILKNAKMS